MDIFTPILSAVVLFVSTNIDDIIVLTLLFLASNATGKPKKWQIVTGQYAGITVLVIISALGAVGLTLIPQEWVRFFGLIPLGLGLRGLLQAIREHGDEEKSPSLTAKGLVAVAGITIANGGDNIAVYTPFFHGLDAGGAVAVAVVFTIMVALWCAIAAMLGKRKRLVEFIESFEQWLVPAVFILLGLAVLFELI